MWVKYSVDPDQLASSIINSGNAIIICKKKNILGEIQ